MINDIDETLPAEKPKAATGPMLCAVCGAQAGPVIVGGHVCCADPRCTAVALHWVNVGYPGGTFYEREAIRLGGKAGGKFLQEVGQTDMARLTRAQWEEFLVRILTTYRAELRRLGEENAPPF
jgi:hypothetical protein